MSCEWDRMHIGRQYALQEVTSLEKVLILAMSEGLDPDQVEASIRSAAVAIQVSTEYVASLLLGMLEWGQQPNKE